ncbi:hypothetical protein CcI49_24590 [Frankia sp. CcI49]|uniref:acyl-CoA thioesterase n=1 Tax=Frankia sp. CcI49 TaxID=1745382 RepID=UPI0006D9823A|nr:acyl-CoA thioesterase domain-containing protein [Frankia sp. CcI49]KPM50545.1 hypothetical protein ACG83_40135 [Frankia sp. R43]ONH58149.1 hypothetical protein CcI49_24590 [Frankia sp. CcI49]
MEDIDRDVFRARWRGDGDEPVHTGLIAVQAQLAATRTVSSGPPVHSLHAHFPRPAQGRRTIVYLVDRVRDGGGATSRRVTGVQGGEVVCVMSLLFRPNGRTGHQLRAPAVPPPADLDRPSEATGRLIDLRVVADGDARGAARASVRPVAWVRLGQALPDDPPLHAGALTYLADHVTAAFARQMLAAFVRTRQNPHPDSGPGPHPHPEPGRSLHPARMTSLDHAVWIHQPFRADQWLLVVRDSPSGSGYRTLTRASFFSQDGRLVASSTQDAAPA